MEDEFGCFRRVPVFPRTYSSFPSFYVRGYPTRCEIRKGIDLYALRSEAYSYHHPSRKGGPSGLSVQQGTAQHVKLTLFGSIYYRSVRERVGSVRISKVVGIRSARPLLHSTYLQY